MNVPFLDHTLETAENLQILLVSDFDIGWCLMVMNNKNAREVSARVRFPAGEYAWLKGRAKALGVSVPQVVRKAMHEMRSTVEKPRSAHQVHEIATEEVADLARRIDALRASISELTELVSTMQVAISEPSDNGRTALRGELVKIYRSLIRAMREEGGHTRGFLSEAMAVILEEAMLVRQHAPPLSDPEAVTIRRNAQKTVKLVASRVSARARQSSTGTSATGGAGA